MVSYNGSRGCADLRSFFTTKSTSQEAYDYLLLSGKLSKQMIILIKTYMRHDCGLTDFQASKLLCWDPGTVSARRNDITKRLGYHIIVNSGKRNNGVGRSNAIVWCINKHSLIM